MNSLLKRQIRKYLTKEQASDGDLSQFLDAVSKSYSNFDEQFTMQQRAMAISSDELFRANQKLREEAESQKQIIDKLRRVTKAFSGLKSDEKISDDLDELKLVEFIDKQAKEILSINIQREKLLKELEHQNQELSDYAHMVSHDLKSPLRSIDTLTTWLIEDNKDKFDDDFSAQLNLIRNNVEKMDALISGILSYSTIGKNEVETYKVDLNSLLKDVLKMIEIPNHISVNIPSLPSVNGDKYRLQQLFQNLISNAVKYNDKNQGYIEIGFTDKNEFWEFSIKDNGKGIDEVYFNKIFKVFEKLENIEGSTGVGLSIVKKIVDLYGGKIWLTSEPGIGSTFYFTLKKKSNGEA